jgi:hypothetical protein
MAIKYQTSIHLADHYSNTVDFDKVSEAVALVNEEVFTARRLGVYVNASISELDSNGEGHSLLQVVENNGQKVTYEDYTDGPFRALVTSARTHRDNLG